MGDHNCKYLDAVRFIRFNFAVTYIPLCFLTPLFKCLSYKEGKMPSALLHIDWYVSENKQSFLLIISYDSSICVIK